MGVGHGEGVFEPRRSGRDFLLDHLDSDGCCHGIFPYGIHGRRQPLEDLHERGCLGHSCCRRALLLHASPIVYRYIDWTITVPLQMVEFYLILSAVNPDITPGMFWRLLLGTIAMLCFGYMGESKMINAQVGFFLGMCGWGFILQEIFVGEAGTVAKDIDKVSIHTQNSFNVMRFIVTAGWCIYPLGY